MLNLLDSVKKNNLNWKKKKKGMETVRVFLESRNEFFLPGDDHHVIKFTAKLYVVRINKDHKTKVKKPSGGISGSCDAAAKKRDLLSRKFSKTMRASWKTASPFKAHVRECEKIPKQPRTLTVRVAVNLPARSAREFVIFTIIQKIKQGELQRMDLVKLAGLHFKAQRLLSAFNLCIPGN